MENYPSRLFFVFAMRVDLNTWNGSQHAVELLNWLQHSLRELVFVFQSKLIWLPRRHFNPKNSFQLQSSLLHRCCIKNRLAWNANIFLPPSRLLDARCNSKASSLFPCAIATLFLCKENYLLYTLELTMSSRNELVRRSPHRAIFVWHPTKLRWFCADFSYPCWLKHSACMKSILPGLWRRWSVDEKCNFNESAWQNRINFCAAIMVQACALSSHSLPREGGDKKCQQRWSEGEKTHKSRRMGRETKRNIKLLYSQEKKGTYSCRRSIICLKKHKKFANWS